MSWPGGCWGSRPWATSLPPTWPTSARAPPLTARKYPGDGATGDGGWAGAAHPHRGTAALLCPGRERDSPVPCFGHQRAGAERGSASPGHPCPAAPAAPTAPTAPTALRAPAAPAAPAAPTAPAARGTGVEAFGRGNRFAVSKEEEICGMLQPGELPVPFPDPITLARDGVMGLWAGGRWDGGQRGKGSRLFRLLSLLLKGSQKEGREMGYLSPASSKGLGSTGRSILGLVPARKPRAL